MTREEEINKAYYKWQDDLECSERTVWQCACRWADEHPQNPWINVEERLPEDNKTVLVWFGGCYKVALLRDNEWWECTGYQTGCGWSALDKIPDIIASSYITHWMPIPQNKKGEKQ